MNTLRKKASATLCLLALAGILAAPPSHAAAIPVIDDSNILQQAKTYAETIKIVQNTKEQIQLYTQDLTQLPKQLLNTYKETLQTGWNRLQAAINKNGGMLIGTTGIYSSEGVPTIDVGTYLQQNIPAIAGNDLPGTLDSARSARFIMLATIMRHNQDTVTALQDLFGELDEVNAGIQEAMEATANATGSVQAQQAANQLAALQQRSQSIQAQIQGLKLQQEAITSQAAAQEKVNQYALEDARAEAEHEYIAQLKTVTYPEPIEDPWLKASTWKW